MLNEYGPGKAAETTRLYESLQSTQIHGEWLDLLPAAQERDVAMDIGCGSGRDSQMLRDHGYYVLGVDQSPDMLEHARAYHEDPGITFFCDSLPDLFSAQMTFPRVRCSFILCSAVWQYLHPSQYNGAAQNIKKFMDTDALLVITLRYGARRQGMFEIADTLLVEHLPQIGLEVVRFEDDPHSDTYRGDVFWRTLVCRKTA